jgi:hypothetical protein
MNMQEHGENLNLRRVSRIIKGMPATDGAGVELTRVIGQPVLPMLDPFLLLDAFRSDKPEDYIAGFPPHPHRGFETVTYLLAGRMRHKDNAGHEGVIEPGGVDLHARLTQICIFVRTISSHAFLHSFKQIDMARLFRTKIHATFRHAFS